MDGNHIQNIDCVFLPLASALSRQWEVEAVGGGEEVQFHILNNIPNLQLLCIVVSR